MCGLSAVLFSEVASFVDPASALAACPIAACLSKRPTCCTTHTPAIGADAFEHACVPQRATQRASFCAAVDVCVRVFFPSWLGVRANFCMRRNGSTANVDGRCTPSDSARTEQTGDGRGAVVVRALASLYTALMAQRSVVCSLVWCLGLSHIYER